MGGLCRERKPGGDRKNPVKKKKNREKLEKQAGVQKVPLKKHMDVIDQGNCHEGGGVKKKRKNNSLGGRDLKR